EMIYTVQHLNVYKPANDTRVLPTQVRTAGNSAMCGVDFLTIGQELVLTGSVEPSHLEIDLCSYAVIDKEEAEQLRSQ
ncbi:hypothetical protein PENTCL1PPCAC_4582, partial [Pristionchus entomophagus]